MREPSHTLGIPMLVLAQQGVADRGIFNYGAGHFITTIPVDANRSWIESQAFEGCFNGWIRRLSERKDIFLGYSSTSKGVANNIKNLLEYKFQTSVLDWASDLAAGPTILQRISEAAALCSSGIFLFTRDDKLEGTNDIAAPRDNVIFEAGYFAQSKGTDRILIIREDGSKMPADLGGHIYAPLKDRSDISSLETQIEQFLRHQL